MLMLLLPLLVVVWSFFICVIRIIDGLDMLCSNIGDKSSQRSLLASEFRGVSPLGSHLSLH